MYDSIIIGAGQAGLAAAYQLQRNQLNFLILEATDDTAGSWPHYYENLRVFSPVGYSNLPEMPFPGPKARYPNRADVIGYLRKYAQHYQFPIRKQARVTNIAEGTDGFRVTIADGAQFQTKSVIVATGAFNEPNLPELPNAAAYQGQRLHTYNYVNPQAFSGKRVLVIGAGNSAIQVAADLVGSAERVTIASRKPFRFGPQRILGKDVHFFAKYLGIDRRLPRGYHPDASLPVDVIDTGTYRKLIKAGAIETRPMFTAFTEDGVTWGAEVTQAFDVVIYATGYRPKYTYLPAAALSKTGRLQQRKGISTSVPGLYFVGQAFQRNFASATIRGVGADAAFVVNHLLTHVLGQSKLAARWQTLSTTLRSAYCQRFCNWNAA